MLVTTWRPIMLAALIIAQKVWDDRSLHNADFSVLCPMFSLREINHLEKTFLELINYEVCGSTAHGALPTPCTFHREAHC